MNLNISGFGEERSDMNYSGFADWLVTYMAPPDYWKAHKSYALCEIVFLFGGLAMIVHSFKKGGRWPWLLFAAMGHGFVVEFLAYFAPFIENFWHAQGIITFFDRRMAIYIIFLYPVFYYHSSWALSKMKLKNPLVEHMAVGLMTVLIDMPYDIIGIKYVHWIWHDTDPNIYDRHYWVPWNSYYFHLCFSTSFQFWFHTVRALVDKRKNLAKWEAGSKTSEIIALIAASFLGMPGGCLLFVPFYHPLHDFFKVPTEVTSVSILIVFTAIVWKFDRKSNRYEKPEKMDFISKVLIGHLIGHYLLNLGTAIFINPDEVITIGLHEKIGNCNETVPVHTILKTLERRKYLCVSDYDEKYYDFHCLPDGRVPMDGSIWYTVCGTPFENRAEYITVLSLITFIAFMVFSSFHFDYDENITDRLSVSERKKLLRSLRVAEDHKQKFN